MLKFPSSRSLRDDGLEPVKSIKLTKGEEQSLHQAKKEGPLAVERAVKEGFYMRNWKLFDKGKICQEETYVRAVSACLGVSVMDLSNLREREEKRMKKKEKKKKREVEMGKKQKSRKRSPSPCSPSSFESDEGNDKGEGEGEKKKRNKVLLPHISVDSDDSKKKKEESSPLSSSKSDVSSRRYQIVRKEGKDNEANGTKKNNNDLTKSKDSKKSIKSVKEKDGKRKASRENNTSDMRAAAIVSKEKYFDEEDKPQLEVNPLTSHNSATNSAVLRNKDPKDSENPGEEDPEEPPSFFFGTHHVLFLMWLVWLLFGSVFYTYILDLNFATGFYMAVNIGYSIGFGDISEEGEIGSQWLSTVYVLIGASFVGAALGLFAERIMDVKDSWYENERRNVAYVRQTKDCHVVLRAWYFYQHNSEKFRPIILWALFIVVATVASYDTNDEFNFANSAYFAVASLSTGGHYSLPGGNREWVYGLTGLYCAIGVPVMAVAMATIASFFINTGSIEDTLEDIKAPVTQMEIDLLTEFGLADEDGEIDKSEFIILCMVRTGAASPELIKLIEQYFNELDADHSGTLSIDEILQQRKEANAAADKLFDQVAEDEVSPVRTSIGSHYSHKSHRRRSLGSSGHPHHRI